MNTLAPNNTHFDGFRLARELMDEHKLTHWKLRWAPHASSSILGKCYGGKKLITINRMYFVMTTDKSICRNTILHEIAHALEYEQFGDSNHGPRWKEIAKSIGCTGDRCTKGATTPKRGRAGLYKSGTWVIED